MLNNPRSTERDNQNSLRKYPFSDGASCVSDAGVIPPGAIIDAQLYVPGRTPGRVWVSSVDTDGKLHFSDDSGEFAELSTGAFPEMAVPVVFTGDGGPCHGGVVVFGKPADVSALTSLGGQTFEARQTELAPAAVAWPGLPGVLGFRLDDGHVVYGDVKIRGENGCLVATYVDADGRSRLRISAMGKTADSADTSGFVTKVVLTSDNTTFVVSRRGVSRNVVDVTATGVATMQDDLLSADQESLCSQVRMKAGTVPSMRATESRTCEDRACGQADATPHRITLYGENGNNGSRVTWTADANDSYIPAVTGSELNPLISSQIATAPAGKRFAGYYDAAAKEAGETMSMYYRYDGTPARRFTEARDVALYAKFVYAQSRVEVTFDGYGTLHVAAPSDATYTNPLRVSGCENPIPRVKEYQDQVVETGGADALAEIMLHPAVPSGEVHIGLRGANKVSLL